MLTRIPEIVLGALLACALFAMGLFFGSSQYSGPTTRDFSTQKSRGDSGKTNQQEGPWVTSENLLALFTLGLIVVGSVQVWLFFVQLRLIRESLTDAKIAAGAAKDAAGAAKTSADASLLGLRPWISCEASIISDLTYRARRPVHYHSIYLEERRTLARYGR
jgi:hypothetical protein